MKNRILLSALGSISLILSCQIHGNNLGKIDNNNNFKVLNATPDPEASSGTFKDYSVIPLYKDDLDQSIQKDILNIQNTINKKQRLNFDTPPSESLPVVNGSVIVFYHNNDKFRVKTRGSISSINSNYASQINAILDKYNVESVHTLGYYDPADKNKIVCKKDKEKEDKKNKEKKDKDDKKFKVKHLDDNDHNDDGHHDHGQEPKDDKCDTINYVDSAITTQKIAEEQQLMSKYYEGEFPDDLSVHVYNFPNNIDSKVIARELRALSFVRNAYVPLAYSPASSSEQTCPLGVSLLGFTSQYSYGKKGSDPFFDYITNVPVIDSTTTNESRTADLNKDFYWFDRHQIIRGWDIAYNNGPIEKPRIAVIDNGFDVDSNAIDRPNYLPGYSVTYKPVWWRPWSNFDKIDGDVRNNSNVSPNHGGEVASLIGAPSNNNEWLAGIAPNSEILPVRFTSNNSYNENGELINSLVISEAIKLVGLDNSIDIINISQTVDGTTATLDPLTLKRISEVVINSDMSKAKVVVVGAGNNPFYIKQHEVPNGCIIVGGTTSRKQIVYKTSREDNTIPIPNNLPPDNGTYIWRKSAYGEVVDISASAEDIILPSYDPNTNQKIYIRDSGTSFSTPLISGACGLIKKVAKQNGINLSPAQIENIVKYSGKPIVDENFIAYRKYSYIDKTRYLGADLADKNVNPSGNVNARNLDLYNALTITKNLGKHSMIVRQHNVDDYGVTNVNTYNYIFNGYKTDQIIGLDNPSNYKANFEMKTLNLKSNSSNTGYAYGYQVFSGKKYDGGNSDSLAGYSIYDELDGMTGVYGAENNSYKGEGYLAGRKFTINQTGNNCNPYYFVPKAQSLYGGSVSVNSTSTTGFRTLATSSSISNEMTTENTLAKDINNLKTNTGDIRYLGVIGNINNPTILIDGKPQEIVGGANYVVAFKTANDLTTGLKDVTIQADGGTITLPNAINVQNNTNQTKQFPTSITVNGVTTNLDYGYIFNPQSQGDLTDYSFNNLNGIKLITRNSLDNSASWINDNGKWGLDFSNSPFSALEVPDGNYEFLDKYTTIALVKLVKDDSVIGANTGFYLSKWWSGSYYDHSKLNNFTDKQLYIINTNQGKDPNTGDIYYVFKSNEQVTETGVPFAISESLNTITNIKTVVKNQSILSTSFVDSAYPSTNLISVTDGRGRMFFR
ncbi:MAG: S8/S53 family peptidase [Candidatus Sericytochromatia bacterium]